MRIQDGKGERYRSGSGDPDLCDVLEQLVLDLLRGSVRNPAAFAEQRDLGNVSVHVCASSFEWAGGQHSDAAHHGLCQIIDGLLGGGIVVVVLDFVIHKQLHMYYLR